METPFSELWSLIVYYLLACAYFWVSALQLRYGYPEEIEADFKGSTDYTMPHRILFSIYRAVPFLFEVYSLFAWFFLFFFVNVGFIRCPIHIE